jgi:four helix bundle protein
MHATEHPADRLEDRLIDFAVRIIAITGKLPVSRASEHISRQLLCAGTSPAPNYGEARGAESRADFVHKLKIALKELNETSVWLKMTVRARLAAREMIDPAIDECRQLSRILSASIQTARRNARTLGT